MINFSLEKFRSSDATETSRVKNSDNVLTKSRKLETKSSWIIKLTSFLNLKRPKNLGSRISISPYYLYTDLAALMFATMTCVHSLSYETHSRSGPLTVGGTGSLNLLNLPLLRHCVCVYIATRNYELSIYIYIYIDNINFIVIAS